MIKLHNVRDKVVEKCKSVFDDYYLSIEHAYRGCGTYNIEFLDRFYDFTVTYCQTSIVITRIPKCSECEELATISINRNDFSFLELE